MTQGDQRAKAACFLGFRKKRLKVYGNRNEKNRKPKTSSNAGTNEIVAQTKKHN
jgi:hypothetical protein